MVLDWVLGNRKKKRRKRPGLGRKPSYEEARDIAATGDVEARRALAAHEDLEPEILYYFATDEAPEVRRQVADNRGTPLQADIILADDADDEVRCELAYKIGRMIPELTPGENQRLTEMALEVLDILARDELPRVRAIIAEELKNTTNAPKAVIRRLAEDLDEIVSVPVLEYSPLLAEADLLEIVARGIKARALVAVARRRDVTEPIARAVVDAEEPEAVQTLLENKTARIGDDTMDKIAERAEVNTAWHNAMVFRDDLPLRTVKRIASFVSAALMEVLIERNEHQKALVEELRKTVRKRIEAGELPDEGPTKIDSAEERVKRAFDHGELNEARLDEALDDNDMAFVRLALPLLANMPPAVASTMMNTSSAKAITALAWKAGLTMEMAVRLQLRIARLPRNKVLQADDEGGYPLSDADLEWYVESFFV